MESHEFDHAFEGEVFHLGWVLSLFLEQAEHCTIDETTVRVVVELTDRHLMCLLFVIFNKLLQVIKHIRWVTSLLTLLISVLLGLLLLLLLGVEFDLLLKGVIVIALNMEVEVDLLNHGRLSESLNESTSADIGPELLRI